MTLDVLAALRDLMLAQAQRVFYDKVRSTCTCACACACAYAYACGVAAHVAWQHGWRDSTGGVAARGAWQHVSPRRIAWCLA